MNKIIIFFGLLFILNACQSTKDAFTLKKNNSADEFLVEKKSPLVVPPDFDKLPSPSENKDDTNLNQDASIKELVDKSKKNASSKKKDKPKNRSIENIILEKIK